MATATSRQQFLDALRNGGFTGDIRVNEPMSRHTTMKVGGTADVLVMPGTVEELRAALTAAGRADLPVTILGGSNLIVRDYGLPGVVIKLSRLNRIQRVGDRTLEAEAGVLLPRLARAAARYGLSGLEFAAGIPGTVGGSIVMNAGTRDAEVAPLLERVTVMGFDGTLRHLDRRALRYHYRQTELPPGCVVSATFALTPSATARVESTMTRLLDERTRTQPLHSPSAGCIFRNPPGDSAGRLIESAGLKGVRIGDAQVSERHANFVINRGHATADDVLSLIRRVGREIQRRFGITLELEVKIVGRSVAPKRSGSRAAALRRSRRGRRHRAVAAAAYRPARRQEAMRA